MNRIFKTVFSRSRGAMMVANELTKSHQVGKKAGMVVSTVALLGIATGAMAASVYGNGASGAVNITDVTTTSTSLTLNATTYGRAVGHGYYALNKDTEEGDFTIKATETSIVVNTGATVEEEVTGANRLATQFTYNNDQRQDQSNSVTLVTGKTNIVINGGTFGNYMATDQQYGPAAESHNNFITVGDSIKEYGYNTLKDQGKSSPIDIKSTVTNGNLTINGGTFNSLIFGGTVLSAYAFQNVTQSATVSNSTLTLNGGTFNQPVFLGGAAYNNYNSGGEEPFGDLSTKYMKTHVETASLTVGKNAEFIKPIYAGGLIATNEHSTKWTTANRTAIPMEATVGRATIVISEDSKADAIYGYGAKAVFIEETSTTPSDYYKTAWNYSIDRTNSVKTNLTLQNGSSVKTVELASDSSLNVEGKATVTTLTFKNGTITGKNGTLKLTTGDFGSGVTLDGTLTLDGGLASSSTEKVSVVGEVTIKNNSGFNGTVSVDTKGVYNFDASDVAGSKIILNGGTVQGTSTKLFTPTKGSVFIAKDHTKVDATAATSALSFTTSSKGTIALLDEGYYTNESLSAMTSLLKGDIYFSIAKASLYKEEGKDSELQDGFVQETEDVIAKPTLPTSTTDKSASIKVMNTGAQTVVIDDTPTSSASTAPVIEKLEIKADTNTNFVLVGDQKNSPLLSLKSGSELKEVVFADNVTVQIGSDNQTEQTGGTLPKTTVKNMNVSNVKVAFDELKTKGDVSIGNNDNRGVVTTPTIKVESGSKIFLDPIWVDGATMADASQLEVTNGLDSTIDGSIIVGRNSVMTYGATVAQAQQGLDGLGLKWGEEDVSAALYIGHTLDLGTTGGVYVDGSLYQRDDLVLPTVIGGTVNLADGSLLMINAATVGEQAVEGNLTVAEKATVAVVNAADGKFVLSDNAIDGLKVLSDNQFVDASYDKTTKIVTTDVNEQKLAVAVASLGIVQMARRADTVMANTIADRTAQKIAGEDVSLWADVGGERYEADDLDNKAQYKANMFYGAFGLDVGLNPNARIGAAVQYGTGDSKSGNYNIKNDIDAVSLGLYGTYNFNENMKVVGEFAYTMSSNDVTSSERLLKNDIDADVISLGVRGQHDYKVGAFNIVPSLGVRVTRICTDDFNVGGVKVDLDSQTLVQVPMSVAFSAYIEQAGWTMKPYAKVSFTPSFGDDEINVRGYKQDALDTMPVQGDFGLSATNGNVTFGASLSAGFGQDGAQSFGGKVGIRYAF